MHKFSQPSVFSTRLISTSPVRGSVSGSGGNSSKNGKAKKRSKKSKSSSSSSSSKKKKNKKNAIENGAVGSAEGQASPLLTPSPGTPKSSVKRSPKSNLRKNYNQN